MVDAKRCDTIPFYLIFDSDNQNANCRWAHAYTSNFLQPTEFMALVLPHGCVSVLVQVVQLTAVLCAKCGIGRKDMCLRSASSS